jgi:hypothetical protein
MEISATTVMTAPKIAPPTSPKTAPPTNPASLGFVATSFVLSAFVDEWLHRT